MKFELGEVIIIGGLVIVIGYGLYKGFGSLTDGLQNAWQSLKDGISNIGASASSAASGAATYIPGTQGSANINTPPPSPPTVGVPPGYDWTTGTIKTNDPGVSGVNATANLTYQGQ